MSDINNVIYLFPELDYKTNYWVCRSQKWIINESLTSPRPSGPLIALYLLIKFQDIVFYPGNIRNNSIKVYRNFQNYCFVTKFGVMKFELRAAKNVLLGFEYSCYQF